MDFGATWVLSEHPSGFVFGDAQDDCLGVYDLDGAQLDRACHDWLPRPPLPPGKRRELEAAFERRGSLVSVRMPDGLPAFDRVFWDDERLVYRVLEEEGLHLAAQGGEGGAEAFGGVPAAPWLFVADGTALAAWDEFEGARGAVRDAGRVGDVVPPWRIERHDRLGPGRRPRVARSAAPHCDLRRSMDGAGSAGGPQGRIERKDGRRRALAQPSRLR